MIVQPLAPHGPTTLDRIVPSPRPAHWSSIAVAALGAAALVGLGDLRVAAGAAVVCMLVWGAVVLALPTPRGGPRAVLAAAVLIRVVLLFSPPSLSDDLFRYLWEGKMVAAGENPYLHAPADPHFATWLADPIRLLVNHADITTIYPPLALMLFSLLAQVAYSPLSIKVFMGLCDALLAGVLAQILVGRGRPLRGAWLYALLPLAAVESAGSGHLEAVALLCVGLAIRAWDRGDSGMAWAGLGALLKLLPGALVLGLARRQPWLAIPLLALAVLAALPFLDAGPHVLHGLSTYARHWSFNGSVYPLTAAVLGEWARPLLLVCGAAVSAWALVRRRDPAELALWVGGAFVLLSPTVHPWYIGWAWVPAIVCGVRAWTVLAGLAPIAYIVLASVHPETGAWKESHWPALVAYGGFAAVWLRDRAQALVQPGPSWQTVPQ